MKFKLNFSYSRVGVIVYAILISEHELNLLLLKYSIYAFLQISVSVTRPLYSTHLHAWPAVENVKGLLAILIFSHWQGIYGDPSLICLIAIFWFDASDGFCFCAIKMSGPLTFLIHVLETTANSLVDDKQFSVSFSLFCLVSQLMNLMIWNRQLHLS